ncbi:MAG: BamA/TamA family outer membrane protein [Bacteroidetes bacterium]|nr:BamA/TamA family outer membrane protein [Bacteroidota bacterium]
MKKGVVLLVVLAGIFGWIQAQQPDSVFHFRYLQIIGNRRTHPSVFLRETGRKPGDTVQFPGIQFPVWQKRLSSLGLFNHVLVESHSDTLLIQVAERVFVWGLPMLGWGDRNFNIWWKTKDAGRLIYGGTIYINNIWGRAYSAEITAIGGYNQVAGIRLTSPFTRYNRGWSYGIHAQYMTNHELWVNTAGDKLQFLHDDSRRVQQNFTAGLVQKHRLNYFRRLEFEQGYTRNIISDTAFKTNPQYLLGTAGMHTVSAGISFTDDHRNQRDYPTGGHYLRLAIQQQGLYTSAKSEFPLTALLKASFYKPFRRHWVWVSGFTARYTTGYLPYNRLRALGYQSDYVRGYEPWVADGNGFVLGKLALRRALLQNRTARLGRGSALKNYRRVPISLWMNIFADAGRVLTPALNPLNTLNKQWMTGAGAGLDFTFYYDSLVRVEAAANGLGTVVWNFSFKNAF